MTLKKSDISVANSKTHSFIRDRYKVFSKLFRSFVGEEQAGVTVIMSLSIIAIFTLAGIGIEVARATYVETRLAFAADAAAIAGARYDIDEAEANALKVFRANFPEGYMGLDIEPTITVAEDGSTVSVEASGSLPTVIGKIAGVETLAVVGASQVRREFGGLELAMVLDVTGSMAWDGKLNSLKTAAKNLIDIIYEGNVSRPNTGIALIPYVASVNIGSEHTHWLSNPAVLANFPGDAPWKGCVLARPSPRDTTDDPPSVEGWPVYFAESTLPLPPDGTIRDNDWLNIAGILTIANPITDGPGGGEFVTVGPNRSCGSPITPLINNSETLKATIDTYTPNYGGGTFGNLGMVWGWRTISPRWVGLWGDIDPKPYDASNNRKAMIMLTDGVNTWFNGSRPPNTGDPTAYGASYDVDTGDGRVLDGTLGTTSLSNTRGEIDDKFETVCNRVKDQGIEVYTLTFKVSDNDTKDLFRACASKEEWYFNADSGEELIDFFGIIAHTLKTIRITK